MKKILTFLFVLLSFNAMAQAVVQVHPNQSNEYTNSLTIIGERNQNFWLFIDDVLQNDNSVNSIQVNGFEMKDYYVRVEIDNQLHNCFGQYVNMSRSRIFEIEREDEFYGMEAENTTYIRPQLTMNLIISINQGYSNMLPPMAMSQYEFGEVKTMIEKENFDNSRLTLAKQIAAGNALTASQITEICHLFSFENNALEFAKYAYPYCIDPNRYYLVNQAFKYESSKRELNELIGGR